MRYCHDSRNNHDRDHLAVPIEQVWSGYTTPEDITQWNFASDEWCCPSAEVDLTVGGIYQARMEAKDGSFGFDFTAVYQAIEPGKAITMVLDDGRKVRTSFEPVDGGTRVETVFDAESENPLDMQRDGWQAILTSFQKHVERTLAASG